MPGIGRTRRRWRPSRGRPLEDTRVDGALDSDGGEAAPVAVDDALAVLVPVAANVEQVLLE